MHDNNSDSPSPDGTSPRPAPREGEAGGPLPELAALRAAADFCTDQGVTDPDGTRAASSAVLVGHTRP
ncbi:hypothetical protein MHW47_00255 [Streptomyces sp. OfavH-34-F]|uniref:hypothetical protein n=1 Tax=Streptomyces sp. OfavH-34-F TaxID=2917760 RepID=UPI001EF2C146|nr:hypothetical protein [Streptomyces sp. OfavH-34-F]MCG7522887.1 hypothetical protein [Streptomyces sp. OfavH-34-F]